MEAADMQIKAAQDMSASVDNLRFAPPVIRVYNPLDYAAPAFETYVKRYGAAAKRVLFLGMNPGPWGMTQTGVPFGEVNAVKNWLHIEAPIGRPADEHPRYPVDGFACTRSEVSGRRLWGLFRERFGTAAAFFREHFVVNYCPLLLIAASTLRSGAEGARNLTPDKLKKDERAQLYAACDQHLRRVVEALTPEYLVGIGNFAFARAASALSGTDIKLCRILHPSPASPQSNRDWGGAAVRQLLDAGVWR